MRILLGYSYYRYPVDVRTRVEAWALRLRNAGVDVHPFCLTLNPPDSRLTWPELERAWKWGTPTLLAMYEDLARTAENYDVFVNWNGINLHPEFVRQLPTFNVYACADDPESSEDLSKPVAAAYDLALVNNIAEVETYRSWGVKDARFWPLGFFDGDYDPSLTKEDILEGNRDIDIALICERQSGWRRERLDRFETAFPDATYRGAGWPAGFLPESQRVALLQRTKIGPNFHNSTGPINLRTYMLPANGVMQICDNKSHLGGIFEIGREVLGFEDVRECIELCEYYLHHDRERREIAANGWERATRDYNEVAVFRQLIEAVRSAAPKPKSETAPIRIIEEQHKTIGRFVETGMRIEMNSRRIFKGITRRINSHAERIKKAAS
jgi:hypothetical protein